MNGTLVSIRELAAWGLDREADRSLLPSETLKACVRESAALLCDRAPHVPVLPCVNPLNPDIETLLSRRAAAVARSGEFREFDWKLAVVNLNTLIAFQRRIGFEEQRPMSPASDGDFESLLDLTLPEKSVNDGGSSPFVEVGLYRNRWFLRDGYHRCYLLLRRGIHRVPAVIVHIHTLPQLGAVGHKFFSEEVLFSRHPPMVADFTRDGLILRYFRSESSVPRRVPPTIACQGQEEA